MQTTQKTFELKENSLLFFFTMAVFDLYSLNLNKSKTVLYRQSLQRVTIERYSQDGSIQTSYYNYYCGGRAKLTLFMKNLKDTRWLAEEKEEVEVKSKKPKGI